MDGQKHRWFIALGALLAVGVLLLARQWVSTPNDEVPAHASATAIQPTEPEPGEAGSTGIEAGAIDATPSVATPASTTGATFRGRIIDAATRRPVREFEIKLIRIQRGDSYREEPPLTQTFQTTNGRFAWNDVPAGTWTATVSAHGYRQFRLAQVSVVASKPLREVTMPLLQGFTVRGRVFDLRTGAGIAEAYVGFRDPSAWRGDEDSGGYTQSKEDGSFELDGVPGGDITLSAGAKEHTPREVEVVVNDAIGAVDIGLPTGGAIAGRVVTSAGAPVTGMSMIMLSGPRSSGGMYASQGGEFSFGQLSAGNYTLMASTPAGGARQELALQPGERRSDVILTVAEGRSIRGTIRGLRPEQLKEASVSARLQGNRQFFHARPDDQGAYVLNGLPPGRASLTAYSRARQLNKTVEVSGDKDLVVDIVFPSGARLSGRVTQGGKPAGDKFIVMGPADGKAEALYHARSSEDGQYEIEGLPAGDYRLRADEDISRALTITGDAVLNIEIPLVQLGGRVLEADGAVPIVGADVYVRGTDTATSRVHAYRKSDHFGLFNATGLEPGDIQFTVYKPGYELYREKIVYSSPITNKTVKLRRGGGGVEIRVHRAANGEPAHGFLVNEDVEGNDWDTDLWIPLDGDGIGFMPSALAGSTLTINRPGRKEIVIREWDGSSLDLTF